MGKTYKEGRGKGLSFYDDYSDKRKAPKGDRISNREGNRKQKSDNKDKLYGNLVDYTKE